MDYFTKEIVSALKALHADIVDLLRLIQQQIDSASKNSETHKEADSVPVAVHAELSTPVAISVEAETHERKSTWDKIKTGFEMIGIGAVIIYAFVTYNQYREMINATDTSERALSEARYSRNKFLDVGKQQFQQEQRPYVWSTTIDPCSISRINTTKICADIYFANYGKSPAIKTRDSVKVFYGNTAMKEADKWFNNLGFNRDPESGSTSIMPPWVPPDPKTGIGGHTTAISDKIPTGEEITYIGTHNFAVVYAARIEYFDTSGNSYYSDMCWFRMITGAIGRCHTHNEIK